MKTKGVKIKMHHSKIQLAVALVLSFSTLTANATLTVTDDGLGVYSSISNITWTQDANLLGTMEASNSNLINTIISDSASYISSNFGSYTLTNSDFGANGAVNWWGAQAFVHYLNSIHYAGSMQWRLPYIPPSAQAYGTNVAVANSELGALFYNELGGIAGQPLSALNSSNYNLFSNIVGAVYWSGNEASDTTKAWELINYGGRQGLQDNWYKNSLFSAWAVSHGNVSAVPVPAAAWLFLSSIVGFLGLTRNKKSAA